MVARARMVLAGLLCSAFGCLLGCATWDPPQTALQLPIPAVSYDTVVCELAFLQWDTQQVADEEAFWRAVDEQVVPPEIRRRLADNGLRVGLISGQLPAEVRHKLAATGDPIAALTAEKMEPGTEMLSRREKRQCRMGISELVEVLPQSPQRRVVLFNEDGRVWAEQFEQPRGFFTLTAQTPGDGPLRLEVVPGLEYGQPRQRVIGNQGAFRFDVRRDQRLIDELAFHTSLQPGQTLVITSTPEPKGLGATFFAQRFTSDSDRLFLLLRAARAQSDDLFAPADIAGPLVTPVE